MESYDKLKYIKQFAKGKVEELEEGTLEHFTYSEVLRLSEDFIEMHHEAEGIDGELHARALLIKLVHMLLSPFMEEDIMGAFASDKEISDEMFRPVLEVMAIISVYKKH